MRFTRSVTTTDAYWENSAFLQILKNDGFTCTDKWLFSLPKWAGPTAFKSLKSHFSPNFSPSAFFSLRPHSWLALTSVKWMVTCSGCFPSSLGPTTSKLSLNPDEAMCLKVGIHCATHTVRVDCMWCKAKAQNLCAHTVRSDRQAATWLLTLYVNDATATQSQEVLTEMSF